MRHLKDNLWLWGQTPGSHHKEGHCKLPGENRMTPAEGCAFFGIPNCCRVVMANTPRPPFDNESRQMEQLRQVVWSVVGSGGSDCNNTESGDLEEVIRQAKMFPNITGAVLDDFLNPVRMKLFPPEKVMVLRHRLKAETGRDLDLWGVWYEHQFEDPGRPFHAGTHGTSVFRLSEIYPGRETGRNRSLLQLHRRYRDSGGRTDPSLDHCPQR